MRDGRWLGRGAQREPPYLVGTALEVDGCALERLLGELGLDDVLDDADETRWLAGVVDHDFATAAVPGRQTASPGI